MPELADAWLVDKPAGPTSHDVVAAVRRRLPRKAKVGHTGTLDPFATGLLVVLAGRATRLAPFLTGLDKRYLATVRLGARSVTGDPEGPITPGGPLPDAQAIDSAVASLRGPQMQQVPAFSAVKVDGRRLYRSARAGQEVARPVRPVVVYELDVVEYDERRGDLVIDTRVSTGTYIRQLAVDLGEALGCGGYCAELRRTAVGDLRVEDAVTADDAGRVAGMPLTRVLGHLPRRVLTAEEERRVATGRSVGAEGLAADGDPVALVSMDARVVAVAEHADGNMLHPAVVLGDCRAWSAPR